MDIVKLDRLHDTLNELSEVRRKIERLDNRLGTNTQDQSKRNIGGFMVSPELFYGIHHQIKQEYVSYCYALKARLEMELNDINNDNQDNED